MTRYFYAAGQRRELDLPSGMVVINRASLSDDATARLSATGVAHPGIGMGTRWWYFCLRSGLNLMLARAQP